MSEREPARVGERVRIMGVEFDAVREGEVVERIVSSARRGEGGFVVTANLDHLWRARGDAAYGRLVRDADMVVADGMSIVWASRLAGRGVPERVAGSTLIEPLAARLGERGGSVFLLGGNPGVAEQAGEILRARCPGVRIAGTACPPIGFEKDPREMGALEEVLRRSGADVVLVALGSPKQENLIQRLRKDLGADLGGAWWIGIGIGLSFITGDVTRAPVWMQRAGLEWAHRLVMEPRRLAGRYLARGVPFGARLMASAVWVRVSGRAW